MSWFQSTVKALSLDKSFAWGDLNLREFLSAGLHDLSEADGEARGKGLRTVLNV